MAQLEDPSKNEFATFLEEFQLSENIAFLQEVCSEPACNFVGFAEFCIFLYSHCEVRKFHEQYDALRLQMSSIWNRFISVDATQVT